MAFDSAVVIGLEVHAELSTRTKLFCSCPREGSSKPNSLVCPTCLGHPGSKPVLSEAAVLHALKVCKALGCTVHDSLVFSRKSYFYPDMSKNFQVTQFREPLGADGSLPLADSKVGISRVHLEEDPASLVHPQGLGGSEYVLIDYNRAGRPLVEIVTKPQLASAQQAREFLGALVRVLEYLDVFDSSSVIKADANVSVRESGYVRVEVKNITGFKEVERALTHEINRQRAVIRRGEQVVQETRAWSATRRSTTRMRTKEEEADYGYIYEPDLRIVPGMRSRAQDVRIPELAFMRSQRFVEEYGLSVDDAEVMVSNRLLADLFEKLAAQHDPLLVSRWLRRELLRVLNYAGLSIEENPISFDALSAVIRLVGADKVSENTGQQLMELLVEDSFDVDAYVQEEGLLQVTDSSKIRGLCEEVVEEFPDAVADVRSGEEKALNFLVGQVMRKSKGAAEPTQTRELLQELI